MGFAVTPSSVMLLAVIGLIFIIFAGWAIHTHVRSKSKPVKPPVLPQISYHKPDPLLRHSLYSCKSFDITNPRDSTGSLTLSDHRYSTPPPAYASRTSSPVRPRSTIHPSESRTNLSFLRQSIYGDESNLDGPRSSSTTSLVPTRVCTPASSRAQSMYIQDSEPSLSALRQSIYGDSNPVFTHARTSSQSLPLQRPHSQSPTRVTTRHSSRDLDHLRGRHLSGCVPDFTSSPMPKQRPVSMSPIRTTPRQNSIEMAPRGRQPSGGVADIQHPLHVDSNPMTGNSISVPRSRNSSATNLAKMNNRFSCPSLTPSNQSFSAPTGHAAAPPLEKVAVMKAVKCQSSAADRIRSATASVRPAEYVSPTYEQASTPGPVKYALRISMSATSSPANIPAECSAPPPVYAPIVAPRRSSQYLVSETAPGNPSLKRSNTLRLVRAPSTESLRSINQDEFGYLSGYVW